MSLPAEAADREVLVMDSAGLRAAIESAEPGDRIVLLAGDYKLRKLIIRRGGAAGKPITLTAFSPAETRIRSESVELIKILAPHWVFEKLTFAGNDRTHHAVHIAGDADDLVLKGNRFLNFHSAIKGNPEEGQAPDRVTIERNIFMNDAPRETRAPTTPIDVLGGEGWTLRGNFFADFGKSAPNSVSYAAFLKGRSRDGLIERNLVVCQWHHAGGRRIGLSFGGGGSPRDLRSADGSEHDNGILRNNIIINCPNAPGIYLNRSANTRVYNNTIYNAFGIMARFPAGRSFVRNNIVSGAVSVRDGARLIAESNLTTGWELGSYLPGGAQQLRHRISDYHIKFPNWFDAGDIRWAQETIDRLSNWLGRSRVGRGLADFGDWFVAPEIANFELNAGEEIVGQGLPLLEVTDDFCGQPRPGQRLDLGAIEYRQGHCDVEAWLEELFRPFEDQLVGTGN